MASQSSARPADKPSGTALLAALRDEIADLKAQLALTSAKLREMRSNILMMLSGKAHEYFPGYYDHAMLSQKPVSAFQICFFRCRILLFCGPPREVAFNSPCS